uniref:Cullin-5 n=1 Tax=Trichuris muris TaxID=70415 RepID=A0A5S6QKD0_TRIMR
MSLQPRPCDFDEVWARLRETIGRIISNQPISHAVWDDNFHDVYMLCIAFPCTHSIRLYDETKSYFESYVGDQLAEIANADPAKMLTTYLEKWKTYYEGSKAVDNLYRYLNAEYIAKQRQPDLDLLFGGAEVPKNPLLPIGELAVQTWQNYLVIPLLNSMVGLLLQEIDNDRNGQPADYKTMSGVIRSFIEMNAHSGETGMYRFYETVFESKHIQATTAFYKRISDELLANSTVSEYMELIIEKIEDERNRSRKFLPENSCSRLCNVCQEVLVRDRYNSFLEIMPKITAEENKKDLQNMFLLLKPLEKGLNEMIHEYESHIRKVCLSRISNLKGENVADSFVDEILKVYDKYNYQIEEIFNGHHDFTGAFDRACLQAVNYKDGSSDCVKAAEWLAKYTDKLLRKNQKNKADKDLEIAFSKAVVVLRYVDEKDLFRKAYGMYLAKRLISGTSVSLTAEEIMIARLKVACGFEFVSKFARMIMDVEMSKQFANEVNRFLESNRITADVPFTIQVLQSGSWPLSTQVNCPEVPQCILNVAATFEGIYRKHHSGRKLSWMYHLGSLEISLNYLQQQYTATVNMYQYTILQCFSHRDQMPQFEMLTTTNLDVDIFEKNLQSLLDIGVLVQEVDMNENSSPVIHLNFAFQSKRRKFKVPSPAIRAQEKAASQGVDALNSNLEMDRKHFMECIVVRIMKAHKVMKHFCLVQEVVSAARVRFLPDIPFVKQTIENLIEKNYLKRTENAEEYAYLA